MDKSKKQKKSTRKADKSAKKKSTPKSKKQRKSTKSSGSWKPGQSGNPAGRPKIGYSLSTLFYKHMRKPSETRPGMSKGEEFVEVCFEFATKGNQHYAKICSDRFGGKLTEPGRQLATAAKELATATLSKGKKEKQLSSKEESILFYRTMAADTEQEGTVRMQAQKQLDLLLGHIDPDASGENAEDQAAQIRADLTEMEERSTGKGGK